MSTLPQKLVDVRTALRQRGDDSDDDDTAIENASTPQIGLFVSVVIRSLGRISDDLIRWRIESLYRISDDLRELPSGDSNL